MREEVETWIEHRNIEICCTQEFRIGENTREVKK